MQRRAFLAGSAAAAAAVAVPRDAFAQESDAALTTPSGTIAGTLLLPPGNARAPVALIIAGSGPTDRNGNGPGLQLNTYQKLAGALAAAGIATLRYDKRGIAASRAALPAEADLRFGMYADDAAAWLTKLRADPRFSRIAVIGHSEGSLVGMLAAQRTKVDAYVSLEGAGFPIATVLRAQVSQQLQPYPQLAAAFEAILTSLSAGTLVPTVPPELLALFRPSVQPYLISWIRYDPRVEIVTCSGRVTIVQGSHDVQVTIDDGAALAAARPSATYVVLDNMTHVLNDDPGTTVAAQLTGAYADAARPLDAKLITALITAVTA